MSELLELLELGAQPRGSEVPTAVGTLLEELVRALDCDQGLVALYDADRAALRGSIGKNLPRDLAEALDVPIADREDPLVTALRTGSPQQVGNVATDPRFQPRTRDVLLDLGLEQLVVAPLYAGEEAMGVVVLSRAAPFTDAELSALLPLANRAGARLAVERDVDRLRGAGDADAIEKEWLWWMVNSVADPVVVSDEQNDIVMQNRRAELLFRASREDSAGRRHAVSMNNFLFTAALSTWKLQQGDSARGRELTLVDPIEGTDLIFEVIAQPATNYRLGQRGMVSVLKNVTDLRQVTEELSRNVQRLQSADLEIRTERDRLDLILRSVPNPIIVMGNDNEIITLNEAAQRVFGGAAGSAEGRSAEIALRNNAKFTSFLAQLRLDPGQRKVGELALTHPGTEESLEMVVTATEIRDAVGAVAAVVTVMQDVGRLRELERRRLEQALFESEKLAATGRLAASIAHEINNPLEAIQNSLFLLVNRVAADDPNYRFLEIAMKETQRMSRILRQMLGFYRPAASMGPTDANALIEEADTLVAKRLKDRRVTLLKELDPRLPQITASADQLKQVILNLLLNAAESMSDGGTVTVSTGTFHNASTRFLRADSIQIQIRDTGAGIDEEHMSHIFEPFFSTKGERGTGLGLWVSSGIVQAHGGTLQVRSRPGRGTTFTITLPIGGPPKDGS